MDIETITVALASGAIEVAWLPGGTYAQFSIDHEVDVMLTATRDGLSNDSENPADWNGIENKTLRNGPSVTYYRGLIYDEQKKPQTAISDYLMVLKNSKEYPMVNYLVAVDYDMTENYKEALKYYNEFISSYSQEDEYLNYAKSRADELKPYVK